MRIPGLISTATAIGALALLIGDTAQAQSNLMFAIAWSPVDQTAERIFRQADVDKSGFLTPDQFKAVELKLNNSIFDLARRGALQGLPPNALNAQSNGVMLPGATQISRPEFVLEARSRVTADPSQDPICRNAGARDELRPAASQVHSQRNHNGGPQPRFTG